jgi:hypothetical protein
MHQTKPVYEVRVGERVAQVAEGDLADLLRELVTAVLAEGGGRRLIRDAEARPAGARASPFR